MINVPHLYRRGRPPEVDPAVVERVLALEARQRNLGVQPIYTLRHLAHLTTVDYGYLRSITSRARDGYDVYEVAKRSGSGKRSIAAPEPPLAVTQRWLLDNVFAKLTASSASYAYIQGKSAVDCAREHVGARWLLKLDLKDFFHQIDEIQVFGLLRAAKYEPLPAFEIARICTRHTSSPQPWLPAKYSREASATTSLMPYSKQRLGYLPQGSPSSGAISNLVAINMDAALTEVSIQHHLTYTRYADDISFSSAADVSRALAGNVIADAGRAIERAGFEINTAKTRVLGPGSRMRLLGVLIDGPKLRLTSQTRDRIEFHLRGMRKFGTVEHGKSCGFRDTIGLQHHVRGLIDYANDVDPDIAKSYMVRFRDLAVY